MEQERQSNLAFLFFGRKNRIAHSDRELHEFAMPKFIFQISDIANSLDIAGYAVIPSLVSRVECEAIAALYENDAQFRSRVVMARHGFGKGEYKYLRYPLPDMVHRLRAALYLPLSEVANT